MLENLLLDAFNELSENKLAGLEVKVDGEQVIVTRKSDEKE